MINQELFNQALDYIIESKTDLLSKIIKTSKDANCTDSENSSLLTQAMWNKNMQATKLLISRGAKINGVDDSKDSPLSTAAWASFDEGFFYLIENGADIKVAQEKFGASLLHVCAIPADQTSYKIVKWLIENENSLLVENNEKMTPYQWAKEYFEEQEFKNNEALSLLENATKSLIEKNEIESVTKKIVKNSRKNKF